MRLIKEYKAKRGGSLPPAGSQQIYVDGSYVSPQFAACASLAKQFGENIEFGSVCEEFEEAELFFSLISTEMIADKETERKLLKVKEENSDKDLYLLLKDFRFPLVAQGMHKRDVWQWYADHDYLQIRANTITCQAPVIREDGTWEPCGMCTSCILSIHANMLEPFTQEGLARYRDYEENHIKEPERFRLKGF